MSFVVIIPARFASTRLPGKPLVDINGKPMIVHVLERARESGAERIIVATDHDDVARAVEAAGGEVCMTRADHQSGTERLAEVVEKCGFSDDTVIVNVQGDEPMIPAVIIRQVAENLAQRQVGMATLAVPVHSAEEAFNPNAVKVVLDGEGYALYFSRATIPWDRDRFAASREEIGDSILRHLGIYGYRAGFIRRYVTWQPSPLENIEMLEQLRVLWYGEKIHVAVAQEVPGTGVDTPEDLARVRAELRSRPRSRRASLIPVIPSSGGMLFFRISSSESPHKSDIRPPRAHYKSSSLNGGNIKWNSCVLSSAICWVKN